jgi:hypothetical protein
MISRRLAALRPARSTARDRTPRKNRTWRFILFTFGSGLLAAVIAVVIAGVPTVLSLVIPVAAPPQINASALFPPVPAVHKTVDVYDPPPKRVVTPPRPVAPTSPPERESPSPTHSPRPTPPPDD